MSYSSIVRAVFSQPWAILPEKLEAIAAFVRLKASGGSSDPALVAEIRAANAVAAARAQNLNSGGGSIAVIPVYGILNQRYAGDFSGPGGTSVQQLSQAIRSAVNDPNVKAIVLDIDSPGGSISGIAELAAEIRANRGKKKITAVSNTLCASAAYWLAAQCTEIAVSPTSLTGSIGVYQAHEDDSAALEAAGVKITLISAGKYKVEGNSVEPLTDEARKAMQAMVDTFYGMFTADVAKGRGTTQARVAGGLGQGRVLTAQDAVSQGLADRVATLDDVLAGHGVKTGGARAESYLQFSASSDGTGIQATSEADIADGDGPGCTCACEACVEGNCAACTHAECNPEEEGCVGCGMASSAAADEIEAPDTVSLAAQHRARRLRLAAL